MPYHPLPRFKEPNNIHVGDWGKIHCKLYTKDDLMFYDNVDVNAVSASFKNNNNQKFKVTRNGYGKFFVHYYSKVSDLNETISISVNNT